jgi:hypothetical protein
MMGDPVHPGAPGQLMMAAALLKELGAEPFVSSVVIDPKKIVAAAKGCKVNGLSLEKDTIRFTRLDECLPFPIPEDARAVLPLYPTIRDLSQYTFAITGVDGDWMLTINGTTMGMCSADELSKGINLTGLASGPIADQGKAILAAVAAKEALVSTARGQSRAALASKDTAVKEKFDALLKEIDAADARIRTAAKPRELKFELKRLTQTK